MRYIIFFAASSFAGTCADESDLFMENSPSRNRGAARLRPSFRLFISVLSFAFSIQAFAVLGEKFSVSGDAPHALVAAERVSPSDELFEVYVYASQNRAYELKEFVSSDGVIFAISWKGARHPDLSLILGNYWNEYNQSQVGSRHFLKRVSTSRVVVEKRGHMRSARGRAYLPELIPSGVSIKDLK